MEYELTDYISVPSSFARESFIKKGFNEDRILVHSLGVDLEEFKQIPKRDKTFRVIYAGKASFRKGFHYLLKAFYELNLPKSELCHLGTVDDDMKDYVGKYTTNKVRFLGHINQDDLIFNTVSDKKTKDHQHLLTNYHITAQPEYNASSRCSIGKPSRCPDSIAFLSVRTSASWPINSSKLFIILSK